MLAGAIFFTGMARGGPASAQPVDLSILRSDPVSRWYVGAALSWVHHTGRTPPPNPTILHEMQGYGAGGKVFVGYRFTKSVHFEVAYHYLGSGLINEGFPVVLNQSRERSQAISGSALYFFPALSEWLMPTYVPTHVFLRGGLAFKRIEQQSLAGAFSEDVLSAVIGAGLEYTLNRKLFARLEFEHLTTAIGGPMQTTPLIDGLFLAKIGGTHNVTNVMHTQFMFALGLSLDD